MSDSLLGVRRLERGALERSEWDSVVVEAVAAVAAKDDSIPRRVAAGHASGIEVGLYVDGPENRVHHVEVHECGGLLARVTLDVRRRDEPYVSANPTARGILGFIGGLLFGAEESADDV